MDASLSPSSPVVTTERLVAGDKSTNERERERDLDRERERET